MLPDPVITPPMFAELSSWRPVWGRIPTHIPLWLSLKVVGATTGRNENTALIGFKYFFENAFRRGCSDLLLSFASLREDTHVIDVTDCQ